MTGSKFAIIKAMTSMGMLLQRFGIRMVDLERAPEFGTDLYALG